MTGQELTVQDRMRTLALVMCRGMGTYPNRESWAKQLEAMADEVDALSAALDCLRDTHDLNSTA